MVDSYEKLIVWQKSMDLVIAVYELTDKYPKEERYNLTLHSRRTVISIPSNIAEGNRRGSRKDYRHFLLNAFGSGAELETQIKIAKRLCFITEENGNNKIDGLLDEVMRMLNSMINKLK